ncbi:response regulator [Paenibacillus sp. sptzw28]|uniref:response regulator n=1 Tax=Paenibacillus sp. sptzw28 TaxID=715179 RepID=UPI001C6F1907|nr:response regulator [Paenibacillus sp. sptzw28]QYR21023.1 response regulator [Paenibacillus sp. sptzw28]
MIKVLIVDDELLMRIGLKSMIHWEEYGFTIIGEASNGKEALDIAASNPPDLIITDIKMPVMDGLELIRTAAQLSDSCRYVILSCMEEFHYVKEALKLGAVDYLVKSDLKHNQLIEMLDRVKPMIRDGNSLRRNETITAGNYQQTVSYLKEQTFKEMISGLKSERDFIKEMKQLSIRLRPDGLLVMQLSIDRFETIRNKYIEKDERLLRFSIVNILEEMIPSKWNKEIIIGSSSEYLLAVNLDPSEVKAGTYKQSADRLCRTLIGAMKDFMNISVTVGLSTPVSGYAGLKTACEEADLAVKQRFFHGTGKTIWFDHMAAKPVRDNHDIPFKREDAKQFRIALESLRLEDGLGFIRDLQIRISAHDNLSEQAIRQTYIRVIGLIGTYLPADRPNAAGGKTPYERILELDTMQELHNYAESHLSDRYKGQNADQQQRSYVEMAMDIIMEYYAEDISLQSVASRINVNSSYLSRVFKQEAGDNFIRFLTKVRIDKAKFFLDSRHLKVYEVAEKVGYLNYTYFSKIFKKVVGVTPEEYRNMSKK